MDHAAIARSIRKAPRTPGVYVWRAKNGTPLYIGKAANLRARLSSYPKTTHPRIHAMLRAATKFTWEETPTDIEALILESQLIKRYRPKYNVEWRDDKQYFYVGFTHEDFPHIFLTHQPMTVPSTGHRAPKNALGARNSAPASDYIGPFTEGVPLKTTLRALRGLFPYCTCKQKHHVKCLNAHIGMCPGYCCLKVPATRTQKVAYARNIRAIRDILTGKRDTLIRRLEQEMKAVGQAHRLEEALTLKQMLARITRVFQNAQINVRNQRLAARHIGALELLRDELHLPDIPHRIEGYDIATIQGAHAAGAMVVFSDGRADNHEYRLFNIKNGLSSETSIKGDVPMLRQVLERRLAHPEWPMPDLIVVDGGKAQLNAVVNTLTAFNVDTPVIAMKKNERHQPEYALTSLHIVPRALATLPRALRDLLVHVDAEAHRFSIGHYRRRHRRTVA